MSQRANTLRAARLRAVVELKLQLRGRRERAGHAFVPVMMAVLLLMLGQDVIPGTPARYAELLLAGGLALSVVSTSLLGLMQWLATDREDGALLRLRGVPGGVQSYLLGKLAVIGVLTIAYVIALLVIGTVVSGTGLPAGPAGWATLAWVLLLGVLAMSGLGAIGGALAPDPRLVAVVGLFLLGLIPLSGFFFPVDSLPGPLRIVGAVFPLSWLAEGIRLAFTPGPAPGRLVVVGLVLGAWTVLGAVCAPPLLRRMTRLRSGSAPAKASA
ncbi:ABC transporter permease [Crossiella cryophila]|uniref:Transport permease protein n=1 Tax=Crossiella cryophila TaxID=43355 RepID=A0A7W7CBY8_9PSEU|nr:ABC transporter permease [Crossiella cryophila]MBB4678370.1 ABC-2 type transport system permease protein [Crossiella cryophila]